MNRLSKKLPKSITPKEFKELIKHTPKKIYKIAFLLAYGSGLRLSEVCNLKKENIKDNTTPPYVEVISGKGGKDRTVPIPKGWRNKFKTYLPLARTGRSLERAFKSSSIKASLNPEYSFHSLRHGFATRLIEKGVPINQVQLLLGHSDISTTSIYTKARPMDALESYEELF